MRCLLQHQRAQLGLQRAQPGGVGRSDRDTSPGCATHGAREVEVGWNAALGIACARPAVLVNAGQMALDHVGQCQFVKEDVEKFVARQRKDKIIEPLAVAACLARAPAGCTAFGTVDLVAAAEPVVAGPDGLPASAPTMAKLGLLDVLARNADPFPIVQVAHAALADGVGYRLSNLPFEALNEAAAIDRTLVLAVEAAVHYAYRHARAPESMHLTTTCAPEGTIRTAVAPAFRCSLFQSSG